MNTHKTGNALGPKSLCGLLHQLVKEPGNCVWQLCVLCTVRQLCLTTLCASKRRRKKLHVYDYTTHPVRPCPVHIVAALWSHIFTKCASMVAPTVWMYFKFFARVSILYLKPFVFPQLVPGAVLDESNRGSICNRGATYCKDRESNSRVEEESEQLLILEKMTEILAYDV